MYGFGPIVLMGFMEELLPGTDFIPTALIGWLAFNTTLIPENIRYVRLGLVHVETVFILLSTMV